MMSVKALMREYRPTSAAVTPAARPKRDAVVDDTSDIQRIAATAGKDGQPIGAKQVLALQQTRGNQAVQRLLAAKALQGNPSMVQAHKGRKKHRHPHPPVNQPGQQGQQGPSGLTKLGLNTAPVLDLLANSVAPIGEMSETVKPYSDMLGALSGSVTGTTDQVDPTKDDKVEKGLSGMGGLVGMGQLATKGVELTSSKFGKGAESVGKQLGGKVVPGMDVVSGGYKTVKSGMDYSSLSGLLSRMQQLASSASGKPQVKGAADILIKIINNKIYLAKWDMGTGMASSLGGMTGLLDSYLGEGVMSDYVKVPGTVLGLGGKLLGSDTLWQGLQYLTGERVWSSERYNQENDKMDDQLVLQADLIVQTSNSSVKDLIKLYHAAKEVAPKFAVALKDKATTLGRINPKNANKFN